MLLLRPHRTNATRPACVPAGPSRIKRDGTTVAYYRAVTYARDERLALAAMLDKAGPDADTLCQGWRAADLAAHLVLRERRPDAGAGIMGGPLAGHTRRVQRAMVAKTPYPLLVETLRNGPPRYSLFGIPGADERLNFAEFFVHHEDVRRAQPGWEPRELEQAATEHVWRQLSRARLMLRKIPVGIEFARDDEQEHTDGPRVVRMTVRPRTPVVTVIGPPAELMMWTFGRTGAARVRLEGAEADVTALTQARWSA
jgi:uncharacterized protein (TIGR03085 family)